MHLPRHSAELELQQERRLGVETISLYVTIAAWVRAFAHFTAGDLTRAAETRLPRINAPWSRVVPSREAFPTTAWRSRFATPQIRPPPK